MHTDLLCPKVGPEIATGALVFQFGRNFFRTSIRWAGRNTVKRTGRKGTSTPNLAFLRSIEARTSSRIVIEPVFHPQPLPPAILGGRSRRTLEFRGRKHISETNGRCPTELCNTLAISSSPWLHIHEHPYDTFDHFSQASTANFSWWISKPSSSLRSLPCPSVPPPR